MKTALITGASRGIGREVAVELAAEGYRILLAVRDPDSAPKLGGAAVELIDMGSPRSIQACVERLTTRDESLDVLVNNAGVYRSPPKEVWKVNVRGPMLLTRGLQSLLHRGSRVVMVSSGLGQLASQDAKLVAKLRDPTLSFEDIAQLCDRAPDGYGASKAALGALTQLFAREWRDLGILVNAVSPGWVRTDMGGPGAPRSIKQGASSVLWACRLPTDGPTGGFFEDGRAIPW